jgi:Orange carotenoid protein, N-terminal
LKTANHLYSSISDCFAALSIDQKLVLLWYVYKEIENSIVAAATGSGAMAGAMSVNLDQQIDQMRKEERDQHDVGRFPVNPRSNEHAASRLVQKVLSADPLPIMRQLIKRQDGEFCRAYGALSALRKLLFWYLLAQSIDGNQINPTLDTCVEPKTTHCLVMFQALSQGEQIAVARSWLEAVGSKLPPLA